MILPQIKSKSCSGVQRVTRRPLLQFPASFEARKRTPSAISGSWGANMLICIVAAMTAPWADKERESGWLVLTAALYGWRRWGQIFLGSEGLRTTATAAAIFLATIQHSIASCLVSPVLGSRDSPMPQPGFLAPVEWVPASFPFFREDKGWVVVHVVCFTCEFLTVSERILTLHYMNIYAQQQHRWRARECSSLPNKWVYMSKIGKAAAHEQPKQALLRRKKESRDKQNLRCLILDRIQSLFHLRLVLGYLEGCNRFF